MTVGGGAPKPARGDDAPLLARAARELRKRLELERLFGQRVPLRPLPRAVVRRREPPVSERPSHGDPAPMTPPLTPPRAAPSPRRGRAVAPPVARSLALQESWSPGEEARRRGLLDGMAREVAECAACGLCRQRTQAVFGTGNPCARLMFVGEAPGFDEDRKGEPFVGRAGRLLDDIIRAMRLEREVVYIANVIKCRPPQNRTPDLDEVASCLPYLKRQIEIVSPDVVCALGAVAVRALLGTRGSLGSFRGRFHDVDGRCLRVTYHPAYLLRNPADKRKTWEDMQAVMDILEIPRA